MDSRIVLVAMGLAAAAACAPEVQPVVPESMRHIADVHRAKCGACHVRVEPGSHTRVQIEAALPRHRSRVHLTEAEWAELADYLAPAAPPG